MKRIGLTCLPGLVLLAAASPSPAANPTWRAILLAFAQKPRLAAAYHETEHVGLLYGKIRASGLWCYRRPDHLADIMLSPVRKRYGMNRKEAWSINAKGQRRTIALSLVPDLQILAQALQSLLSGHDRMLKRAFHLVYQAHASLWTLHLTPRHHNGSRSLRALRLRGTGSVLRRLAIQYRNGDWSHYRLTPVSWLACRKEGF
jgi:hypothetical protein